MKEHRDMPARELTTMRCGGTIETVYEPENEEELARLVAGLERFIVIGGGSNVIFPDGTVTTPVIRLGGAFSPISTEGDCLRAGGAALVRDLLRSCMANGLSGLEFLAGIPGTIGGALSMNAGTARDGIMSAVSQVRYVDRQGVHTASGGEIPYGYRCGGFGPRSVIFSASLRVQPGTPRDVAAAVRSFLIKRRNQPRGFSSGSIFKNPPGEAAGRLIEQAGLKGLRIGGAKVSEIHANFIINDESASTADIRALVETIRKRVKERFGIELEEEVRILDERL